MTKPQYVIFLFHGDQQVQERFADTAERAKGHAARMISNYQEFQKPTPNLEITAIVKHNETRETVWKSDGPANP